MLKLNLGSGNNPLPGYTNIDSRKLYGVDLVDDVTTLAKVEDESVDLIYACHVLEHVRKPDVRPTLLRWRTVLKLGGVLRLAVPDLGAIFHAYMEYGIHLGRLTGLLYGRQNYPENTHYAGYDFETLSHLLAQCGYYDVKLWEPSQALPEGYSDYSTATIWADCGSYLAVSLNVEAIRTSEDVGAIRYD